MYRYNSDTERLVFRHRGERVFMSDGTADTGFISTGAKFCEDCPWGKSDFSKLQVLPCIACLRAIASALYLYQLLPHIRFPTRPSCCVSASTTVSPTSARTGRCTEVGLSNIVLDIYTLYLLCLIC